VFCCRLELNVSFEMFPIFYNVPQQGTVRAGYPCYKTFGSIKTNLINTRQQNKRLLQYTGYMFRPVNRSSSGLQQSKSQVLF